MTVVSHGRGTIMESMLRTHHKNLDAIHALLLVAISS